MSKINVLEICPRVTSLQRQTAQKTEVPSSNASCRPQPSSAEPVAWRSLKAATQQVIDTLGTLETVCAQLHALWYIFSNDFVFVKDVKIIYCWARRFNINFCSIFATRRCNLFENSTCKIVLIVRQPIKKMECCQRGVLLQHTFVHVSLIYRSSWIVNNGSLILKTYCIIQKQVVSWYSVLAFIQHLRFKWTCIALEECLNSSIATAVHSVFLLRK